MMIITIIERSNALFAAIERSTTHIFVYTYYLHIVYKWKVYMEYIRVCSVENIHTRVLFSFIYTSSHSDGNKHMLFDMARQGTTVQNDRPNISSTDCSCRISFFRFVRSDEFDNAHYTLIHIQKYRR